MKTSRIKTICKNIAQVALNFHLTIIRLKSNMIGLE